MKHTLIDGSNLMWRNFWSQNLTNRKGEHVGAVIGFLRSLNPIIRKFNPDSVIIAWDEGKCASRLAIYPEYKSKRQNLDQKYRDSFQQQLTWLKPILAKLPVKQIGVPGIEADDIIGYLCTALNGKKIIISGDTDFIQTVDETTSLYMPGKKDTLLTEKNVATYLGYPAKYYVLWKSMTGDSSDCIKGLDGIGPKRASQIIQERLCGGPKRQLSAEENKILQRNKMLIGLCALLEKAEMKTIRRKYSLEKRKEVDIQSLRSEFAKRGFKQLFHTFGDWAQPFQQIVRKSKDRA